MTELSYSNIEKADLYPRRRPDVVGTVEESTVMKMFVEAGAIYLHRDVVDFRKSINGLVTIVEQEMALSPFSEAVFVFCYRNRDRMKVLWHTVRSSL